MSDAGWKPLPSPADDPDVQEALSRRHAPEVVRLLKLSSGRFAVFNHAGDLCGFVDDIKHRHGDYWLEPAWPPSCWYPAAKPPSTLAIDLQDLGLT